MHTGNRNINNIDKLTNSITTYAFSSPKQIRGSGPTFIGVGSCSPMREGDFIPNPLPTPASYAYTNVRITFVFCVIDDSPPSNLLKKCLSTSYIKGRV